MRKITIPKVPLEQKILIDAAVDTTFESPSGSPVSPTHALTAPKTSSIAVGTSPEYSPASSVASTDTESARVRSQSLISEGDTSEWGTVTLPPMSSRTSSSGASTPERSSSLHSTPHRYPQRYRETSSSSVTSSPASRATNTTSEAETDAL